MSIVLRHYKAALVDVDQHGQAGSAGLRRKIWSRWAKQYVEQEESSFLFQMTADQFQNRVADLCDLWEKHYQRTHGMAGFDPKDNPRFVLNIGAIYQLYSDLPSQGDDVVLWDRQEKRPVFTLHQPYSQALTLELANDQPISALEKWFNTLSNEDLESEGIAPTR